MENVAVVVYNICSLNPYDPDEWVARECTREEALAFLTAQFPLDPQVIADELELAESVALERPQVNLVFYDDEPYLRLDRRWQQIPDNQPDLFQECDDDLPF